MRPGTTHGPRGGPVRPVLEAEAAAALFDMDGTLIDSTAVVVEVPGAAVLVERPAGIPFAVVTSAPRELARRRLRAAGMDLPDVVVAAEDVSAGKPAPDAYLRAAALLGVEAHRCIAFEDAEAGLIAAVGSGARTVVVGAHVSATTGGLPRIPDFTEVSVVPCASAGRPSARFRCP